MAQTWSVIRGDVETQVSGGTLSYRVAATGIGAPPKRNISTRGPFQNGETFAAFRYDKRIISLVFFADSATLALADAQRDNIYSLWRGIEGETITLKVVRDDDSVRFIDGEVINIIDFPDAVGNRFGGSQSFSVQIECHNPFWRSQSLVTKNISINQTTTITYEGQFPTEPIISIIGPITNPIITQIATGKKLDFTGTTIASNDNYQIDTRYGYKTILDGSLTSRIANMTNDSDLADFTHQTFSLKSGTFWSPVAATEANDWQSIAYGNGVWIAVASTGTNRIMRSTDDGVTWSAIAAPEANDWTSIAYGNGVWVAVATSGTNRVMRSTNNGLTWSAISAGSDSWFSVAYDNGVWIAVGGIPFTSDSIMRSTNDGATWSNISIPAADTTLFSVAYGNGVWIAVSNSGPIRRSTDNGLTWSTISEPSGTYGWSSVAYNNNVWIAVANSAITNRVMRSTDNGVTWSAVSAAEANSWSSVAYGNGVWIAVANNGTNRIMRSINNGLTWSATAATEANAWKSIAYGNDTWLSVSYTGTNRIMRSIGTQSYTLTGTGTTAFTYATMTYFDLFLGI